jgi:hypothetical protein
MKGYKTVLFNTAMLALASPDLLSLLPPRVAIYATVFGNIILRAMTSTPIGQGEPSE